ncbi:hypothetical protein C8Q70DRAFT_915218 [Cubamyces menziesii]|uniref:MARVEL domain-containing protein n=1 Tax=Trametes cubensis TaxID=1111947 RepID=A0AAD7TIH5_9APHY|nr:hypothetical protein C8Q70DRAFT_915218 [Cubamyces menziesii]KAJ8456940.1 hypothetical protein ONZ51_g11825 [Trametes cubensis]
MNILWLYRVFTLVLTCILSLVVIALCAHTSTHLDNILEHFDLTGSFPYATLGIAIGCITIVTNIIMLGLDFFLDNIFTSMPVFEVPWLSIVWILWISVGATTLSQGNRLFKGSQCSDFSVVLPDAKEICDDVHPIAIVAFVNFALLFLYSMSSLVAALFSSGSSSTWTTSLKNRGK